MREPGAMEIRVFPDSEAVAVAAAHSLMRRINDAVRRRGVANIAVSGGRTPAEMFRVMSLMPVSWGNVCVWQVDERVAPDGDPARNQGMLATLPVSAGQLHAMPVTADDLAAGAARYAASLPSRFDIIHLGLGDDGHTASWPPGDSVIDSGLPVALSETYNGHVRMTLTPSVVNAARARIVVLAGEAKAVPLLGWLLERDLPISRVRRPGTTVFADEAACSKIRSFAQPGD